MTLYALFCPSSDRPYKVSADDGSVSFFSCFSPKSRGCCFLFFLSLPPLVFAPREKEQVNRAHTTMHVLFLFWFSVVFFCVMMMANVVVMWYPRCIWLK